MSPAQLSEIIRSSRNWTQPPVIDINALTVTVDHPSLVAGDDSAIQAAITAYAYDPTWVPCDPSMAVPRTLIDERAARIWTNQGAGPTEFTVPIRARCDLTNGTEMRANFETTTLGVTAALRVEYSTNGTTWTTTGASTVMGAVGLKTGAWTPLPAPAKADVWLRIVAVSGNGTEDPATRNHQVQVR